MSKKIKYLFVISILVLSLLVLPFSVSAVDDPLSFNVNLSPIVPNDNTRFIEILTKNSNGDYFVSVLIFNVVISPDDTYSQSSVNLSAVLNGTDTVLTIDIEGLSESVANYFISAYSCDSFGNISYEDKSYDDSLTFNFPNKVFGIHYYGFQFFSGGLPNSNIPFFVNYSSNGSILNYLPGMAQDTSEILDYLTSILESNQQFYEDLDNYFQDNNWSLLSNIDTNLHLFLSYFDPRQDNNLYSYLVSMSQDSSDILYYLSTFNDYFQGADWSLLEDLESFLFAISQDTEQICFSLNDTYDALRELEGNLYSYLDMFLEEGLGTPEYDPPSDVSPPRDDSTIQDIEDAEQEALGGMTQEEVKEQVDEVLDSSSEAEEIGATEINVNNIAVVNNLFTDMFGVFGGAWSTFFLLNLTIAFAAFLIGRRY